MFWVMKRLTVVVRKSEMTAIRIRPEALPRFSTATKTSAARRPLSWRLPRRPAWVPPTQVSSIFDLTTKRFASEVHCRSSELVEDHPSRLVTPKPKPTLEKRRRNAPLVGRHQVGGPEPKGQGSLGVVKDGS
jgi:hypothetical protein